MAQVSRQSRIRFSLFFGKIMAQIPKLPKTLKFIKTAKGIHGQSKQSIGRVIEKNAIENPNVLALQFEDQNYSYQTFNEQTNKYANYMLDQGVKNGDSIIAFIDNRPELLFLIAACTKIGAQVSLINPNQRAQTLLHSLSLVESDYFFIGNELMTFFEEVQDLLSNRFSHKYYWLENEGKDICPENYINFTKDITEVSVENPTCTNNVLAGQVYANVFTSGTTGLPKASRQTHRKWLTSYYWFGKVTMNLKKDDVLYIPLPFYHTNALVVGWSTALAASCTVVMKRKFSVSEFWIDIDRYNVSSFIYIGELCRYLLNAPTSDKETGHRIKKIMGNGLRPDVWKELKNRFRIKEVYEFYGAADGNVGFTNTLNFDYTIGWSPQKYKIVDYDIENDIPLRLENGFLRKTDKGKTGLLISEISKNSIFDGYVNEKNNESKILRNVFKNGDTWLNSGDLIQSIGFKHARFVDRVGDTFRWKGENVSTIEVEGILGQIESIALCAVYGVHIPNNDGRAGMVTLVRNQQVTFNLDEVTSLLFKELPRYAVPVFIRVKQQIDVTITYKIIKNKLREEGFASDDEIFILLPKTREYVPLTQVLLNELNQGDHIF